MINETTIKIAVAIIVTVLIVGFIKKLLKFAVIAVCVVIVGMFSYDFIVLGNNPIESVNNIKNDIIYIKDASQSIMEVKKDLKGLKGVLKGKGSSYVKAQNANVYINHMKHVRNDVRNLKHSKRLDALNTSYLIQLDNIISTSENLQSKAVAMSQLDEGSSVLDKIQSELKKGLSQ